MLLIFKEIIEIKVYKALINS